jgi:pimeloyl-ACP methyl ester carboxylesterase
MLDATTAAKPLGLLIPGLDGTGKLFAFQLEALARKYRVCAWSYQAGADFDLADLTGKLASATAGEAPGSILVVGESFGGLVALDYVLRYPDRVRRLILVNTFPYYRWRLRLRLAQALTPLLELKLARQVRHFIIGRVLRCEGIPAEGRLQFQEAIKQIDPKGYRRRLQLIRETDLRPRLGEIAVPTVLLASARDKLVPSIPEAHFMASRIPRSRVHEFPKAGHALLLTPGISLANYEAESFSTSEPGHPTSDLSGGPISS